MKDELRAITRNQRSFDSAVMMSSLMPSEKYSCSGSPLMLLKGSTAMAGRSGSGKGSGDGSSISAGNGSAASTGSPSGPFQHPAAHKRQANPIPGTGDKTEPRQSAQRNPAPNPSNPLWRRYAVVSGLSPQSMEQRVLQERRQESKRDQKVPLNSLRSALRPAT